MRRNILPSAGGDAFPPVHSQPDYPPSQIRFVVPFSPGGGTDVIMRLVAHHLGKAWKITALVENRVGAAGVIGSHYVTTQAPDGTLPRGGERVRRAQRHRPHRAVRRRPRFHRRGADGALAELHGGVPEHGFKSLQDLVAYAKATTGSPAMRRPAWEALRICMRPWWRSLRASRQSTCAQRGTPEAVNDAMAGRVLYAFAPGPNAIPLAEGGKLQILATTSSAGTASSRASDARRGGASGYEGDDWFGVFARGTPLATSQRVAGEISRILSLPEVRERLATLGAEPAFMGPEEFAAFARKYVAETRKLGEQIGIQPQ